MWRIAIGAVILGGFLLFQGYQEWKLAGKSSAEPVEITCAELSANGPGESNYIQMSDFLMTDYMVYEAAEGNQNSGPWKQVYIPAVPLDGEYAQALASAVDEQGNLIGPAPTAKTFRVILKLKNVRNDRHLGKIGDKQTLTGMVINDIGGLDSEDRRLLQKGYGGVNLDLCHILEVDRKPTGTATLAGYFAGGLACLGLAGGLGFMGMRKK